MTKDIEQGNKLIAEFDGWVQDVKVKDNAYWHPERNMTMYTYPNDFDYHSNWNHLMAVVENIEDLGYAVIFSKTDKMRYVNIYGGHIGEDFKNLYDAPNKQYAVFMTVVQFIQWFNTNSKEGSKL